MRSGELEGGYVGAPTASLMAKIAVIQIVRVSGSCMKESRKINYNKGNALQ